MTPIDRLAPRWHGGGLGFESPIAPLAFRDSFVIKCLTKCLRRSGHVRCAVFVFCVVAENGVHHIRSARMAGTITCRYTVSVTCVDLSPTVSLISWIGTPLLLMIDTAVCRPSWACQ